MFSDILYKRIIAGLHIILVTTASMMYLSSCDKDMGADAPEITGVKYLTNDDTFNEYHTTATPGTTLVIEGHSLGGARQVLINGQDVSFNSTFNTDHSIIVTVPTEEKGFRLSAFYDDIPDEIQVSTSHGTAEYAFKITAPYPQLRRIAAIYPRRSGDKMMIYGMNLVDINRIYITDISVEELENNESKDIPGNHTADMEYRNILQDHHMNASTLAYETESEIEVTLPSDVPETGTLIIETAAGPAYMAFSVLPDKPTILNFSSDMPQIGEDIFITGRDFVNVAKVNFGNVEWNASELKVSETQDTIFLNFKDRPKNIQGAELSVTTIGGTSSAKHFYDTSTLVTDFDGVGIQDGYSGGAQYIDAGNNDGNYGWFNDPEQAAGTGWGPIIAWQLGRPFSMPDYVPDSATADQLYIAYEVYDAGDYNINGYLGFLRVATTTENSDGWDSYHDGNLDDGVPVNADINGKFHKNKWYRAVIPLSKFGNYAGKNLAQIKQTGLFMILIQANSMGDKAGKVDLKIDNLRIIYLPK